MVGNSHWIDDRRLLLQLSLRETLIFIFLVLTKRGTGGGVAAPRDQGLTSMEIQSNNQTQRKEAGCLLTLGSILMR